MTNEPTLSGLCLQCAVARHDFKEILAHGKGDDHFRDSPLPAAWIDGRRYKVLSPVGAQTAICNECGRDVVSIFMLILE